MLNHASKQAVMSAGIQANMSKNIVQIQREALEKLGREKLGVKELDDWYSVKARDVHNRLKFIRKYHGSLSNALKKLYPQHNWDMLRFSKVPKGYWNEEAQRDALEKLGRRLGVKELDDWYSVSSEEVKSELSFIGNYYNSSLFDTLKKLYPQHEWDPLKFSRIPRTDFNTQKEALERFGRERLGVKELDDWYSVSTSVVQRELSFIKKYGTLGDTLKKFYPQHDWDVLRFSRVPHGYWNDENVQREALERLGSEKLGVKELDDWYSVSSVTVRNELSFIHKYGSLCDALKKLYPQHDWDPQKFTRVPRKDCTSHREALEKLGRKLGVKKLDDWYSVSSVTVRKELSFFQKYGSLYDLLKKLYPQHNWNPLHFSRIPNGYWNDENVQRLALEKLGKELGVNELDDWYSVSSTVAHRELGFLNKYGSLCNALKKFYPQHKWDPLKFSVAPRSDEHSQRASLERLGEKLGVKDLDDWYSVSAATVHRELAFIKKYGSLFNALKRLYPHHDWDPVHRGRVPNGYWKQSETVRYYHNLFTEWKNIHNIRTLTDWHSLPPKQVEQFKRAGKGIFGSTMKMLQEWFPDVVWQWQFTSQFELRNLVTRVIGDATIKHYRHLRDSH